MIRKTYIKRRKNCYIILFILIFNILSIILLPNININVKNDEKLIDDENSLIQPSTSNLPDRHYFKYYKVIIIDHSKVSGTGSHENFPVLISLFDSDLHDDVQSTGNDIAFADNTGWLDHEIELFKQDYNSTHAKLVAWVRVPSLSTSLDTKLSLYYGNATMSPRENPEGVWNTNYLGVWHLSEEPPGTIYDSTSNDHDGTPQGSMNSTDQIDGQIDGSIDFDGSDDYIDMGSSIDIASSSFSVSTWAKRGSSTSADIIFQQGPAGQNTGLHVGFRSNNSFTFAFWNDDLDTSLSYTDTNWHHWSCTYDASTKARKIYRDGVNIASDTAFNHFLASNDPFYLGYDGMVNEGFHGQLDESRLLNITLSSGWVSTSYNNQNDPNSFYSIGKEKNVSGHPSNAHYFAYYKEIVVEHSMVYGSNDLVNFSVLISLLDSDLKDHVNSTSGNDIAFAYDAEWLDHELELFNQTYNGTHAQLVAWVRIPILSTSWDTIVRMYYGNSTMGSRENPEGVWDNNYKGVWHLSESSGGTDAIKDSTINGNHGTDYGTPTFGSTGKSDGAIDFKGDIEDEYVQLPANTSLNSINEGNYFTYEAWFYPDQVPPGVPLDDNNRRYGIMIKRNPHQGLYYDHDQYFAMEHWLDIGGTPTVRAVSSGTYGPGKYYHIVAVVSNLDGYLKLYVNGNLEDQTTWTGGTTPWDYDIGALRIGIANPGWSTYRWAADGKIDEIRISDSARSADWIKTEYKNQNDPSSFYTISKEYPLSGILPNNHYYKFHKEIIIDYTMVSGSHDLANFPLLFSIFDTDLQDHVERSNGTDIAFAYNGAWLDHEIEFFDQTYNDTHAQLIVWVSIPRLFATQNTIISMYYGNYSMSSRQDPSGVWSSKYKGVWHLSEDPSGLAPQMKDSTANDYDGTTYGSMTPGDQIEGQIDGSLDFDGINDYIVTPYPGITGSAARTISFWMSTSSISDRDIFNYGDVSQNRFNIRLDEIDGNPGNWAIRLEMKDAINIVQQRWSTHIADGNLHYVVVVIPENVDITQTSCYIDGQPDMIESTLDSGLADSGSGGTYNVRIASQLVKPGFTGILDEIRISSSDHSTEWIQTEYNNQYNPQAFLTVGSEVKFESTPPTYSNLIESSNPLELGDTEVITINVSDPSGINQSKIEFEDSDHVIRNHTMINILGNAWQYDSWTPGSVGNYTYTIWMQDNYDNWNSTIGTIEVLDRTPPTYSNLIESQDPLESGKNETIEINVYDLSGVNQTLIEYDSTNHSMVFMVGNKWSWSKWQPAEGFNPYKIYMQDNQDNWNMVSGNITVIKTTAPILENLTESEDPLELGNNFIVGIDVESNETLSIVLIELDGINRTMNNISGNSYEYIWNASEYIESGYSVGIPINYIIYANDSYNNWALPYQASFVIKDSFGPTFSDLSESAEVLELGNNEIITINCTDLAGINQVKIEFEGSNHTMTNIGGDTWQYDSWTPGNVGNYSYTIWAKDNNTNWNFMGDSILVEDTTLPVFFDLTEISNPTEIGTPLLISIKTTDLAGIKQVLIEYENLTFTMQPSGGDVWEYDDWMPTRAGNYSYKIYMEDNNNNINSTNTLFMIFQDIISPVFFGLTESSNLLELGDTEVITINADDFSGINQVLIEIGGQNHSMTKIYGITWQNNFTWKPVSTGIKSYTIYIEDNNQNWNFTTGSITVQDTIPPDKPEISISWSGKVNDIITFIWERGSDPSGILYYILIIDNESTPESTPGYIYKFNITNTGNESIYFELPELLPPGQYWYFLAQIDGVGLPSDYDWGTFTVINVENGTPGINIFLITAIILASVIGSGTAIVLVRKKLKKDIAPPRKKVPLKIITSHLNKLSGPTFDDKQLLPSKELVEEEMEIQINEIRSLGEELFAEGAYLEAQKQFKVGRDLLMNLGREEEAKLFSELLSGIEGLIEEREKRLETLEQVKLIGSSVQVFESYNDIIAISKKLRDPDTASFYQSDLIQFFRVNNFKLNDLEEYRSILEKEADSLLNHNHFESAAQIYEKCEVISQIFIQLERIEEVANFEKFRDKKIECLNRTKEKKI